MSKKSKKTQDESQVNEVLDAVSEDSVVEEAAGAVEEAAETAEEAVEAVSENAEETVETAVEAVAAEAEAVEEAAEETVEETVAEASEEISEETSEEVSEEAAPEEESVEETSEEEKSEDSEKAVSSEEEQDEEEQAKEKSAIYAFFDTLRFVAIGLLVGILLVVFVIQRNDVYGSSMEPTLNSGDAVFVEMITTYTGNFKRGDIVTIDARGMEGYTHEENLIKRVIGLPGETVKIENGCVYINGQLLDESAYLPAGTQTYVGAEGQARGYMEVTLGPDEYYCMGDNRGTSKDSRRLGPFKKDQLEAKVIMRAYPFNKMKFF
ncbi:MAG: signal peptidase I [Clostridiales bacterium]|nr:signal peptidase I [Clostridiales bacterium]